MASGRITIPVGMDTRGVVRGADTAEKALEDLEDATKDAGTGGAKSLDKIEDELKDVQKQSKKTGDAVERNLKDGFDEAGKEADSTAKEVAASFDGSIDSIAGGFQELAANAFSGFGPGGAALGVLAAAGIGIATALFGQAEEKRKELEEKASDLAQAYIDAGSTVLDEMAVASRAADISTSVDPAVKTDLADLTRSLGDRALAIRVLAGDSKALATAQSILETTETKLGAASFAATAGTGKRKSETSELASETERFAQILEQQTGIQKSATQQAQDHSDVLKQLVTDASGATVEVDALGNELYTLPGDVKVLVNADTGQATTDVSNFQGDLDGIAQPVTSVVNFKANTSAVDAARRRLTADLTVIVHAKDARGRYLF